MNDYPDPGVRKEFPFALKALAGFLFTPGTFYLLIRMQMPTLIAFGVLALVTMLAFSSTRAFALGGLLSIGVAFLALLAICGNSHF